MRVNASGGNCRLKNEHQNKEGHMSGESLAMLEKMEDVSAYSRIAMRQFPRYEKFLLAAEIRTAISEIKRLLIRAAKRYYKKTTLEDLDIELELLRSLIREAVKLKYIDVHRYGVWSLKISEVGKMTGAWMKKVRSAQESSARTGQRGGRTTFPLNQNDG